MGILSWGSSRDGPVARQVPSLSDLLRGVLVGLWCDLGGVPALGASQSGGSRPDKLGARPAVTLAPGILGGLAKVPSLERVQPLSGGLTMRTIIC